MAPPARPKILCVDDERLVLEGLTLTLRRTFTVVVAESGKDGLKAVETDGPFAVVVSDMRMPGMDGAAFLTKVRELVPDTVRVLLTGQSDLERAVAAVNEGQIFRFLTKPCPPDVLLGALGAAARQHELILGERVLLEQTLRGCIKSLTDVLSLANPVAFGRASRAKDHMLQLAQHLGHRLDWQAEVAAMLSQIGCVTLPAEAVDRIYAGEPLSEEEKALVEKLPSTAERLLGSIPRLEGVRAILIRMNEHFSRGQLGPGAGEEIPWAARSLKIILDYYVLEAHMGSPAIALDAMRGRQGWYDPALLQGFADLMGNATTNLEIREVTVKDLRSGMVLQDNLMTRNGMLLMAKGHRVTAGLLERVTNFSRKVGIREPIMIAVQKNTEWLLPSS